MIGILLVSLINAKSDFVIHHVLEVQSALFDTRCSHYELICRNENTMSIVEIHIKFRYSYSPLKGE